MGTGVVNYSFENGIAVRTISGSTPGTLNIRAWNQRDEHEREFNFETNAFDLAALRLEGLRQMTADEFARFMYKMATWDNN